MALIFADGFDHYDSTWDWNGIVDLLKKWTGFLNGAGPGSELNDVSTRTRYARPPGGQGLRLQGRNDRGLFKTLPANYATFVCGFNFYTESLLSTTSIVGFLDNGTSQSYQIEVRGDGTGHIGVYRNGSLLGLSTNVLNSRMWYHLEFKATISNTVGAYELRINGTSDGWVPPVTGANTRGQTHDYVNGVALQTDTSGVWFDDFYFLDDSGGSANDFVGPQKIITIYPNAAGNQTDWTGNYAANFANVNEFAADGDSTFNQASSAGAIDLFGFDNVPTGTINAIQHCIEARQDSGTARTLRSKTRIAGTNYDGSTVSLPGTHAILLQPASVSPATSAAWTASELNAAEFGYELVS
jgi:hypothetical protein